jgi:riboflavin kinase/FMN adenylyltransferase
MKVFNSLDAISDVPRTAVALGNFDGIHRGHRELIERSARYARDYGLHSAVFTFANHPRNYIAGYDVVKSVVAAEDKLKIFEDIGVEYLFNIPFDDTFRSMEPESFVRDLLLGYFHAKAVFCGFNFHFGKSAAGNTLVLEQAADRVGFRLEVLEPFIVNDVLVSSSVIRKAIASGDVAAAERFLGRPFAITGEVIRGNALGRKLGFATANTLLPEDLVKPAYAIYVTTAEVDGRILPAITNVGIRPTIGDNCELAETHIFGLDEDLYGREIKIFFKEKIRDEARFDSVEQMQAQVKKDIVAAKEWWKQHLD